MRFSNCLMISLCGMSALVAGPVACESRGAEKHAVAELKESAPEGLAAAVRDVLAKTGYRVTDSSGKTICDLWLRPDLPALEKFDEQPDVKYPIEPGTLIGVLRFPAAGSDFRKQAIKPGMYTLRYAHQPQDGNHLGTAQYRDFAVASPAGEDKSPETLTQEKAMDLSKKTTNTTHPAIFSLLPPQKDRGKLPTMVHDDMLDLEVLVAKTSAKGGSVKEIQIEFVVVGHAAE